ncbi:MAG TPA: phytanoyl-CoA dioxygenase family protein [Iamia sp.]|nr:phytanoyl-CoA dioxygenase family protein [Iamia sp.]
MTVEDTSTVPGVTSTIDVALADLRTTGIGLLAGACDAGRTARLRTALVEAAAAERAAGTATEYHGNSCQRVYRLPALDPVFVAAAADPTVLDAARAVLGPDVLLSNLSANIVGAGGRHMAVHSDQGFLPTPWTEPWGLQVIWPLDDFTEANGATRVVPGSHRVQGPPERAVRPDESVAIECPAGTLILLDGRLWHGTGAHRGAPTPPEGRRHALLGFYTKPWLRTQEAWPTTLPLAALGGDEALAQMFGILPWQHLGLVEGHAARLDG